MSTLHLDTCVQICLNPLKCSSQSSSFWKVFSFKHFWSSCSSWAEKLCVERNFVLSPWVWWSTCLAASSFASSGSHSLLLPTALLTEHNITLCGTFDLKSNKGLASHPVASSPRGKKLRLSQLLSRFNLYFFQLWVTTWKQSKVNSSSSFCSAAPASLNTLLEIETCP